MAVGYRAGGVELHKNEGETRKGGGRMNRKQDRLMLIGALVAGLVGGAVSSWFCMGSPAFAQKMTEPAKFIRAERFDLVDKDKKLHALLSLAGGEPNLALYDEDQRVRAELSLSVTGEPR